MERSKKSKKRNIQPNPHGSRIQVMNKNKINRRKPKAKNYKKFMKWFNNQLSRFNSKKNNKLRLKLL